MNKYIKYVLFFLGLILILGGFLKFFSKNNLTEKSNNIVVDTRNMTGDEIDFSQIEEITFNNLKSIAVKIQNLSKKPLLTLKYPNTIVSEFINDDNVRLSGNNMTIEAKNLYGIDMKSNVELSISHHEEAGNKKRILYSSEENFVNGYKLEYARIQALNDSGEAKIYYDEFQIYIETDENVIFFISFQLYNRKFTDDILNRFINEIKIENNKSNYLYSKNEKNQLTYSFKVDYNEGIKTGTKYVTYFLPSDKYLEIETENNNSHLNTFRSIDKKINVTLSIEGINEEIIKNTVFKGIEDIYKENKNYELNKFDVSNIALNNFEFLTLFYDYKDTTDLKNEYYNATLYTEITKNYWYKIRIESEVPISNQIVEDVTNFKINEKEQ